MRARLITPPSSRTVLQLLAALLAVVAIACSHSQGDGETCQADRDCEDGLICLPARDAERSVCGTREEADLDGGGDDAGDDPDLPPDDAGRGDAGPGDAGDEPSDQDAGDEPSDLDAG